MSRLKRAEPQRTCAGCRRVRDQKLLIRLTRALEGGIRMDRGERLSGRGAYLCPDLNCLRQARRRRSLERALRVSKVTDVDWAAIEAGIIGAAG